jgi:alkylation response protein AidB-like acyl-CoA dehydrogenase
MVAGVLPQAEGVKSSSLPSGELWSGWLLVQSARVAGACSKVLSMTVEYLRTRRQFGVPIGGFQAVQQQLAAAVVLQEGMASLIDAACQIHDSGSAQREFSELSAWRFAQMRGAAIVETCLQLHGGIGFTWEYNLHWHLRAVKTLALLYSRGGGDAHYLDSVPQLPTA